MRQAQANRLKKQPDTNTNAGAISVAMSVARCVNSPAKAAFVGDSPFDMGAGKAAGVFTVAVSWGKIHSVERLRETGADVVVHSPEELLDVL